MLNTYLLRLRERSKGRLTPKQLLGIRGESLGRKLTPYWQEIPKPEQEIYYRMAMFLAHQGHLGWTRSLMTATQRNAINRLSMRPGYSDLDRALVEELRRDDFLYIGHSDKGIPRELVNEVALFANIEELYWWVLGWSLTHKELPVIAPRLKRGDFFAWLESEVVGRIGEMPVLQRYLDHWSGGSIDVVEVVERLESVPGMVESMGLNPRSSMESMSTWTEDKFWEELTALYLYSVNEMKIGTVREILTLKAKSMGLLKDTPGVVNNNLYITEKALTKLQGMGLVEVKELS